MGTENCDSKETLKNLCSNNGWCYGIFWGFDQRNPLLLSLKDAYYEEGYGALIDNMLLQAHVLGVGIIGQAAFSRNDRWMFSDEQLKSRHSFESFHNLENFQFQDDYEVYYQFCLGIETIALISVEPFGVLQFGSTNKISAKKEFTQQVKQAFRSVTMEGYFKCTENGAGFLHKAEGFSDSNSSFDNLLFESGEYFDCSFSKTFEMNENDPFSSTMVNIDLLSTSLLNENDPLSSTMAALMNNDLLHGNGSVLTTYLSEQMPSVGVMDCVQGCNERLSPILNREDDHKVGSSNSLFSKLGLYQFLDTQSTSSSKRRKIDNLSWIESQKKIRESPDFDERTRSFDSEAKETGSSIGNSGSVDAGNSNTSRRRDELVKNGKRRAKMGTKPRPKDRQMIQDRLVELRELIPNGEKMSIDRLLERTIRHLNFLDCLIKHAETMNQIDKPKHRTVLKDNLGSPVRNGVTWACEFSDQVAVCPLKVEDLSTPGQMSIEIRCDEQGFFLEIADLIRGFGLIIVNGVMELLETKIWAHFIVEAEGTQPVNRHEIFTSLFQLLHMTCRTVSDSNDLVVGSGVSLFSQYQSAVSFPVNSIG